MAASGVSALLLSLSIFAADDVDVSGDWELTLQTAADAMKPRLSLEQDEQEITGTYKDEFGSADVTGSVKGSEVTLKVKAKIPGEDLTVTFTGTVESDTMKGRVVFGELGEGTFTGLKVSS